MNRREARKQAFLLIFQYKFQPDCTDELLNTFFEENKTGVQREYIENTVLGTVEKAAELDRILGGYLNDWRIDRISSVSLAALRLAAYEMLYIDDIPPVVSVNEAVALAREFDGEEAAPFVNGVLGRMKDDALEGKLG